MFENFIPLMSSFLSSGILNYVFFPVFLLAVLATVPVIIRELVRMR